MTLSERQQIFCQNIAKLITWSFENGYRLTFGEAVRTIEQQEAYVKSGRSKTMKSGHLNRLAVDFNLFKNGFYCTRNEDYIHLHDYWKTLHPDNENMISWDGNHFEMLAK